MGAGSNLLFVSFHHPENLGDDRTKRLVRSHAVKQALERKRKQQQKVGDNFRLVSPEEDCRAPKRARKWPAPVVSPVVSMDRALDPLQVLAADSFRLRSWLDHRRKTRTTEPMFTIDDELVLGNFRPIFRTGLQDPALINATMLTYAFAETGVIDRECLGYHGMALRWIRANMSSPESAASEATLAAILLMAGIEARLGMPFQVQLHMNAIQQLLEECKARGVYLTDGIKRAIFWQDLNSSVLTGSSRIVHHTTFAELQWSRDPFTPDAFSLPAGLHELSGLLGDDLTDVLRDVHALRCVRDLARYHDDDAMSMAQIDNHQASIQSRLREMREGSGLVECFRLAAYLCAATLRCKRWRASVVPAHLSSRLLVRLQEEKNNPIWDEHPTALAWLLYMGGAFARGPVTRSGYVDILLASGNGQPGNKCSNSWEQVLGLMRRYIWSEVAYREPVKDFWSFAFVGDG